MKRTAEDGHGWGAQPSAKRSTPPPPKTKFAFKVLCPDKLVIALLGSRGSNKEWLQKESGTKLVFSNKGDYYPSTRFRTLGIYSDIAPNIPKCLERILKKVVECGHEERKRPKAQPPDFVGDAAGEFVFRLCLSDKASRALIGPAGTNIQKLRSSSGAKIHVDNQLQRGHQTVRILGRPECILDCLRKLHTIVQQGVDTEDFDTWAQLVNFSAAPPRGPPGAHQATGDAEQDLGDAAAPAPSAADSMLVDDRTDRLADVVAHLPAGAAHMQYSITCELPTSHVDVISEYQPEVEKVSGATVEIDPPPEDSEEGLSPSTRLVSVVGPLLSIYAAHIMITKRSKELEQQELQEAQRRQQQEEEEEEERNRWRAEDGEVDPEDAHAPSEACEARAEEEERGHRFAAGRFQRWQGEDSRRGEEEHDKREEEPPRPNKAELQAKIDMLQAQLAQVQARMAGSRGGSYERSRDSGRDSRRRSWR